MGDISRRHFLKKSGRFILLSTLLSVNNLAKDSEEDLSSLINKVKEKYKNIDFDEEFKLSYKLNLSKIYGLDPYDFIKNRIGATASFEANENEGCLKIKSYTLVSKADYEIRTFYSNNEVTHSQIIDGIPYNFIKREDTFILLSDKDFTTNTFDEEINQDFSTTANDVITAGKNTLNNSKFKLLRKLSFELFMFFRFNS